MAVTSPLPPTLRTFAPRWPARGIDLDSAWVDHDRNADELLVYFSGRPVAAVTVPIDDATADHVSLLVDPETEAVVGLQVDAFEVHSGAAHSAWAPLADAISPANQRRTALARLVADAAGLFALHGAGRAG